MLAGCSELTQDPRFSEEGTCPPGGRIAASGWALLGQVEVGACKSTHYLSPKATLEQFSPALTSTSCSDHLEGDVSQELRVQGLRITLSCLLPVDTWRQLFFRKGSPKLGLISRGRGEKWVHCWLWALLFTKPLGTLTSLMIFQPETLQLQEQDNGMDSGHG